MEMKESKTAATLLQSRAGCAALRLELVIILDVVVVVIERAHFFMA